MEYHIGLVLKDSQERIDFPVPNWDQWNEPKIQYKKNIISFTYYPDILGDERKLIETICEIDKNCLRLDLHLGKQIGRVLYENCSVIEIQFNTEKFDEISF